MPRFNHQNKDMKKVCKNCGKEIKRKPVTYDDYYFCPESTCLWEWEQNKIIEQGL